MPTIHQLIPKSARGSKPIHELSNLQNLTHFHYIVGEFEAVRRLSHNTSPPLHTL